MPDIVRRNRQSLVARSSRSASGLPARTSRALQAVEHRTLVRLADVQADGIVQGEKLREVDRLTHTAMTGQAMLAKWRDTLAIGDPFLNDDLKFFSDIAKMGKGEIIVRTIDCFTRDC